MSEVALLDPEQEVDFDTIRDPKTGKWRDTSVFRQEAIYHQANEYYCPDPWGSPAWAKYWTEQLEFCMTGYTAGNWRVTGDHYFYLNFSKIQVAVQISEEVAIKEERFPSFYDHDYDYYHSLEIARWGIIPDLTSMSDLAIGPDGKLTAMTPEQKERYKELQLEALDKLKLRVKPSPDHLNGGYNMIVGKARRKGYSYKNGAICANTYNTKRKSLTIVGAHEKKYLFPKGTMQMSSDFLNYLNIETGWRKSRDYVDRIDHRKASFRETLAGGIDVERGYQSEIMAVTFMDKPDAARGKDAYYVLLEEAGAFPNLEDAYKATAPGLRAGKFMTGQIIIFGTGGDMESGTADFAKMFYNPVGYKLMPFINIWDDNAENTLCGFFHPFYMNHEGYMDEQGNSMIEEALADEEKEREEIVKSAAGSSILQGRVQEYPKSPSEAFLTVSFNDFPIVELRNQYNKVIRERLHVKRAQPVHLYRDEDGKARIKPDLVKSLEPIWDYVPKTQNLRGAVVMWEAPIENAPKGLYKIGYDPYRQVNGTSLAAIYVYKGTHKFSLSHKNTIVAQFVGRPKDPDDVNAIAAMLAELYNTEVMHENEVTHVKSWFERNKKLRYLAAQPDEVISANITNSKVSRIYGMHMVEKLKDAGEKYIKQWLLEIRDFDENGNGIMNLQTIEDPGLLEELILYSRKGNFDRIMAYMQVHFQIQEEELGHVYGEEATTEDRKKMFDDFFASYANKN